MSLTATVFNNFFFFFFFFAKTCAQSFYRSSPMNRAKDLYTSGPHGLLSYFITAILVPAFFGFLDAGRAQQLPHRCERIYLA